MKRAPWRPGRGILHAAAVGLCALAASVAFVPGEAVAQAPSGVLGAAKESAAAVTVTLTPRRHADGKLFVEIVVATHTVNDLDKYDLKTMVTLEFEGQAVAPTVAPRLRGHHSRGELVFPVAVTPGSFAIKISGLDQPALRVLSWP